MTAPVFSLGELAEQLGATLRGASDIPVRGLASLQEAEADQLSFLANPQYRKHLPACRAAAVLLTEACEGEHERTGWRILPKEAIRRY